MSPVLSIVTGTVDRQQSLQRFVDSVRKFATVDYELLIIDAGREPAAVNIPSQARLIKERPRKTYVAGYNAAFKECRGEFVAWMNDDAEVTAGWDVAAVDFMRKFPNIGIGCMPFDDPTRPPDRPGAPTVTGFRVSELWGLPYANFGIIRRDIGEQVGWFDPELTMYGSDNDITFKVLLAGYGVAPVANAKVIHHRFKDNIRSENQNSRARVVDGRRIVDRYHPQLRRLNKVFWTNLPEDEACGYI